MKDNNIFKSFVFDNKSGIYRIICKINGRFYIGSSKNLNLRFNGFKYRSQLMNSNMNICKDILKYGHTNFSFEIIEYCEPSLLKQRTILYGFIKTGI